MLRKLSATFAMRLLRKTLMGLLKAESFDRGDYKYAAEFILLYLGVQIRDNAKFYFPDLAKASNARFIQRCLYFVMMELLMDVPAVQAMFSAREQETIADMALFSSLYYGPYFLQTTIASRYFSCIKNLKEILSLAIVTSLFPSAARQDLTLIKELRKLRRHKRDLATSALQVMDRHTDYLG